MNKKFSTLVAVLLAAGSFVTVSAVVEVLNEGALANGISSAIENTLGRGATKAPATPATPAKLEVSSIVGASGATFANSSQWKLTGADLTSVALTFEDQPVAVQTDGSLMLAASEDLITKFKLADGKLTTPDGKYLTIADGKVSVEVTEAVLVFVDADGEVAAPVVNTPYVIATAEDLTASSTFILGGEYTAEIPGTPETPAGPGADIEDAPTAITPVLVKLGANYLMVRNDSVALIPAATDSLDLKNAAKTTAASWYVDGGKYKSLANGKYLTVKPSTRSVAEPEILKTLILVDKASDAVKFVAYAADGTTVVTDLSQMAVLGFVDAGTPTYLTATGATTTTVASAATTKLGVSSLITPYEDALATFNADSYYLLSADGTNFIASADGQTTVTTATNNMAAIWKVAETKVAGAYNYTFTNAKGDVLKLGSRGDFASANGFSYKENTGAVQLTLAGKNIEVDGSGKISATEGGALATFGLFAAPENVINAEILTAVLGGGFDLTIAMKSDYTETEIEGNPFNGILTPMKTNGSELVAAKLATDTKYLLKNSADEYIVLDTKSAWSSNQDGMNGNNNLKRGYKFTTLSEEDFTTLMFGGDLTEAELKAMRAQYNPYFSVACTGNPAKTEKGLLINTYKFDQSFFGKLYTVNFDETNVLTTSSNINTPLDLNRTENWPYIKFGGNGLVPSATFLGKAVNVEYVHSGAHGQADDNQNFSTAGRRVDGNWVPVDTTYTQFDKPEGQWMVTKSVNAGEFTLVNRESKTTVNITGLYTTPTSNVYAAVTVAGAKAINGTTAANAESGKNDTLQITIAPVYEKTTGYANFDTTSLKVETFTMAVSTVLDGNVYSTEPDNGHKIGLSKDVDDAAQWRLIKFELGNKVKNKPYNSAKNDTIKSSIGIWDAKGEEIASTDSLYAFAYAFRNDATNEFLKYDADKRAFIVDVKSKDWTVANYNSVEKFLLKEERNGTYQIIPTTIASLEAIPMGSKLYGAFSELKIDQTKKDIYEITNNDLFAIENVNAPLYIGAANAPELSFNDTVKIFKESNNNVVLYERGNFLGMQHVADVEKMAPAMFVDTAFMRNNTYKPQYLLAVRHELIYHSDDCDIPGHDPILTTNVDTVKASYLVNMVDSAKAFGLDKHNNPYIWENKSSFKLAFVDGYHTNDSLYFAKKDAKNAVVKDAKGNIVYDRIFLGNNENRIGKYAFRIVDRSTNAFIIETSYDGTNKIGYIKWLNGTPAVVDNITQAEVFNMLATEETPTDNEGIETTEVTVTAGVGQVTISNAQGKSVAISNILGQTLANTVLTSDNATISVPAGIVVVAVEGEAAAKVIVK